MILRVRQERCDGFGQAVLCAHAVAVPEELEKAQASFNDGCSVAEGAFETSHCACEKLVLLKKLCYLALCSIARNVSGPLFVSSSPARVRSIVEPVAYQRDSRFLVNK